MPNPSISEHTDSRNTPQLGFASPNVDCSCECACVRACVGKEN